MLTTSKKPSKFPITNAMREFKEYQRKLIKADASKLKINIVWWGREQCGVNKFVVMTGHSDNFLINHLKTEIVL